MSSKRDLVEAHSFNRRRLVTAFVSGAPGGREVEPVRYGRTLVGGLVLAALMLAGAAVSGYLKPSVPKDWLQEDGLVIGKTSGSRFVAYKGRLYPVINTTSARLILSTDGTITPKFIPDDKISAASQGLTIGISGAPDVLPARDHLVGSGWTACTNQSQGIKVTVSTRPGAAAATDQAFLVRARGDLYVVAGRHRYPLPARNRDALLRALALDGEPVRDVPGRWLDLVDVGAPLAPFAVPKQGSPADTGVQGLDRVGTPLLVDGRPYVLGPDGLLQLTDFAYSVYRAYGPGAGFGDPLELSATDVTSLETVDDGGRSYPDDWPEGDVRPYTSTDAPCLLLRTASGQAPYAELATPGSPSVMAGDQTLTRVVQTGYGAVVRSTTGGVLGSGTAHLVDSSGTDYVIGGRGNEKQPLVALGYGDLTPTPVPKAWVDLFASGPALTTAAAARASGGQG
jgi:type VII secretion protein EccB